MRNETAQIYLSPGADAAELERELRARALSLPGVRGVQFGRNLEGCWGAGDCTLDLQCDRPASEAVEFVAGLPGVARVDGVSYRRLGGGQRAAGMRNGIWRTLMLRVRAEAPAEHVTALERDLLRMPAYMPGIRNWQLSRVTSESPWSHVWQQEFARVDDLLGEYLAHPFHWGWVDRWFDVEFPEWTVEAISHAFCPFETSILTDPAWA